MATDLVAASMDPPDQPVIGRPGGENRPRAWYVNDICHDMAGRAGGTRQRLKKNGRREGDTKSPPRPAHVPCWGERRLRASSTLPGRQLVDGPLHRSHTSWVSRNRTREFGEGARRVPMLYLPFTRRGYFSPVSLVPRETVGGSAVGLYRRRTLIRR